MPDEARPRPSRARLWLLALVAATLAWHLRAVLLDQRFRGTDLIAILLADYSLDAPSIWRWLVGSFNSNGMTGALLSLPLHLALGQLPLAARLLTILGHGCLVLQSANIARQLTGRAAAGLWAGLIVATFPLLVGLCRLSYHDVVVAVALCGTLQLVLWADPRRWRHMLLLGLVLGLGLLTKLSFVLYAGAPMLWYAARHCRSLRAALRLAVAPAVAAALVALPLWHSLAQVSYNMRRAAEAGSRVALWDKVGYYLDLFGFAPLLLVTVLCFTALASARRLSGWHQLLLLSVVPMLAAVLLPNPWSRYLVPVVPLMAVTVGIALEWSSGLLPRLPRTLLRLGLAGGLVGLFLVLNLGLVRPPSQLAERELELGMLIPDTRRYDGFPGAVTAAQHMSAKTWLMFDNVATYIYTQYVPLLWATRGHRLQQQGPEEATRLLEQGKAVTVLLIRRLPGTALVPDLPAATQQNLASSVELKWRQPFPELVQIARHYRMCISQRSGDGDGVEYWVLRVQRSDRCPTGLEHLAPHEGRTPLLPAIPGVPAG